MQQSDVLNSWKEISNYIGRGVRTVQRWEKDFGLPVRRPCGHLRGSVLATKADVDGWLNSREARAATVSETQYEPNRYLHGIHQASVDSFHQRADRMRVHCVSLRIHIDRLASNLARTKLLREELKSL